VDRYARLLLGILAFVAFVAVIFLIPAGSDDSERRSDQAEAVPEAAQSDSSLPLPPAPLRRTVAGPQPIELSGTIEQVNGREVTIRTAAGDEHRISLRDDARLFEAVTIVDLGSVRMGDAVEVYTETVTSDVYHPPADIGRVRRIDVLADGARGGQTAQCPTIAVHAGTVKTVDGDRLDVQTACGTELFEAPPDVPVRRLSPATTADLLPGVQVTLAGTRPAGGAIEASLVEVLVQ
jgi:hypothetical protein